MTNRWLVIGATSAIARAFVRVVAAGGDLLTLAGRDLETLEATGNDALLRGAAGVDVVRLDLLDVATIREVVAQAGTDDATLNVLMAAGTMPEQDDLQNDATLLDETLYTNFSAPVILMEALVPAFVRQRGGRVVIIGSVAGDRARKTNYLYGATKAALAFYAAGLQARLLPSGATVTLVKPGFVDTPMTWGRNGLLRFARPETVAKRILAGAKKGRHTLYVPWFWFWIMLLIRSLPRAVVSRLRI